ncbi:hypothetical protein E5S67_04974 [Microcoleus sp. IPMA8]|uniref:Secreted protein n=1 Tax=Microcoleus asticus IPMA8 TaxID=2563858 RepID=A0ABX2D6H6_9CYAN|nr:hypothetical protein [Microcoleus asticus IPMA8]
MSAFSLFTCLPLVVVAIFISDRTYAWGKRNRVFLQKDALQPADWVKNPVSFVRVRPGLSEKCSALTASKIWLSISLLGEPVVVN